MLIDSNLLCQNLVSKNYTAIYARHSNLDAKNASNEAQIIQCKDVASKRNLIVYKSYEDEGSGFTIPPENRPGYKQLLLDAKAGYFKTLIIWKIDRLWRQSSDYPKTKNVLDSLGIDLIYSDMAGFEKMSPINRDFMTNMFLSIAELEPNKIKEKTVGGRNYKKSIRIAFLNYKIFGYALIKDKEFIKKKIEDKIVAKATETYYKKDPLESAFINCCFEIYINSSGDYTYRTNQIKNEISSLSKIFIDVTETNLGDKIKSISDRFELIPVKNELTILQENLSEHTFKKLQISLNKCCCHCTNTASLRAILVNHRYCGINIINSNNNDTLLLFDDITSCYTLNHEIYNIALNVDQIIPIDLWFRVATHILIPKSLKSPKKFNDIPCLTIKCDKCKSKLKLKNNLYECPKCHIRIATDKLKNSIVDQLFNDHIYERIIECASLGIKDKNSKIKILERELNRHQENCTKITLEYINKKSESLVKLINSESNKVEEIKNDIIKIQGENQPYVQLINNITPQTIAKTENLREMLHIYYFYYNSKALKKIIKEVIIQDD